MEPPPKNIQSNTLKRSFADVAVGMKSSGAIPLKEPGVHRGEPAMFFLDDDIVNLSSPFKLTLIVIGKFSHGRPSLPEIRSTFETFGLKFTVNIGLLDNKHILIRFSYEEDYHRVWLRVFKWTPEFRVDAESTIAQIWVSFPYLPIHFFSKHCLFSIGRTLGSSVKMDSATSVLARPNVARICIEMDLLKKSPNRIWIGCGSVGFWQKVTYEKVPNYCCAICLKQGHSISECKVDGGKKNVTVEGKGENQRDKKCIDQLTHVWQS